jgi:hypothetical protein
LAIIVAVLLLSVEAGTARIAGTGRHPAAASSFATEALCNLWPQPTHALWELLSDRIAQSTDLRLEFLHFLLKTTPSPRATPLLI